MLAIFQSFGMPELGVILLIALIIFGPKRLPHVGHSLGKALREFREGSTEMAKTLRDGIEGKDEETEKASKTEAKTEEKTEEKVEEKASKTAE